MSTGIENVITPVYLVRESIVEGVLLSNIASVTMKSYAG